MHHSNWFSEAEPKPVCCGAGLLALDIIVNDNHPNQFPKQYAGGSCGNVLTILAFLGWETYPFARLADDIIKHRIIEDLSKWNVITKGITADDKGSSPIIVERITKTRSGIPIHRYEWNCPACGTDLPRYKPVLIKTAIELSKDLPVPKVFYSDRLVPSSIDLAKSYKEQGALIVFEPSSIPDERLFLKCTQVADVLKYAQNRLGNLHDLHEDFCVPLEIETLGEQGSRFRLYGQPWKAVSPYTVENLTDAAGSGDWCTAGIIHLLGLRGQFAEVRFASDEIENALHFGQAMAAVGCQFEGARGSMYGLSKSQFMNMVCDIATENTAQAIETTQHNNFPNDVYSFCPLCTQDSANIDVPKAELKLGVARQG